MIKGFILGMAFCAGWKYIRPILKKAKILPWTKIVKFEDGTYGIRRSLVFCYMYKDLCSCNHHWWLSGSQWFATDCRGTFEDVESYMKTNNDTGTPV